MTWKHTLADWGGKAISALLFVALIGTCSYGAHHARAVHGVTGDFWDNTVLSAYYAGEAVLGDHGPNADEVRIGLAETRVRSMWGAPLESRPAGDGRTNHLYWHSARDDELIMVSVQAGRVALVGRVGAEALTATASPGTGAEASDSVAPNAPWQPLTASEQEVLGRVFGKVTTDDLTTRDLEELDTVFRGYSTRVGRQLTPREAGAFILAVTAAHDYDAELQRCALASIDAGRIVRTARFDELRKTMQDSAIKKEVALATDLRFMESAATQSPWADTRGVMCEPVTRQDVLDQTGRLEREERNLKAIGAILRRLARSE